MNESPIFIHSLFRACSTYIFSCFRRSSHGYWCYQEPLNEFLLNAEVKPVKLLELHESNAKHLRHPQLDQPYFFEYFHLAEQIGQSFQADFPYKDYFSSDPTKSALLCEYLRILVAGAKALPVLQECRSCGRVAVIRECIGGKHIFLWRNPWDQWWSYKVDSYFDMCNLQILASQSAPPLFVDLRNLLSFSPTNSDVANLVAQRLDAAGSYMLFFALWSHAMLEARNKCDIDINIDSLSLSNKYRAATIKGLEDCSILGIDYSDCEVPIGIYGEEDRAFFGELEDRVLELFYLHGYRKTDIEEMLRIRDDHNCHELGTMPVESGTVKDIDRMHQTARRFESELSGAQREAGCLGYALHVKETQRQQLEEALRSKEAERQKVEEALWAKEAERQKVEEALWAKEAERQKVEEALWAKEAERQKVEEALWAKEAERQKVEDALWAKDAERQKVEDALWAKEAELAVIQNGICWRLGKSIRALIRFFVKLLNK